MRQSLCKEPWQFNSYRAGKCEILSIAHTVYSKSSGKSPFIKMKHDSYCNDFRNDKSFHQWEHLIVRNSLHMGGKQKHANWRWSVMLVQQKIPLIMLYHRVKTKLWKFSLPVLVILLFFPSTLEFAQRKVMPKETVARYSTFSCTVQCPHTALNSSQRVHLKSSWES